MGDACEHVYVSSLPAEIDDAKLTEIFAAYGNISRATLLPQTGINAKRAGIISFGTVDEAKWIVENLNGNIPQGLTEAIEVKYKQNKDKGKGGGKPDYAAQQGYDTKGGGYGKADASWAPPAYGAPAPYGMAAPATGDSVFFADLPAGTDEAKLQEIFGAYGTIKFCKICGAGKEGKLSAIVNFGTTDEAKWIVENLNGNIPQGLAEPIKASYKLQKDKGADGKGKAMSPYGKGPPPPADWGKGGGFDAGKGKGKDCGIRVLVKGLFDSGAMPGTQKWPIEGNALFVGGLPHDTSDLDLYKIFSVFGALLPDGAKAMIDVDGFSCKGIGFVNFADPATAQTAITTLNGTQMPDGRTLKVSLKQKPGEKGAGKGKDAGAPSDQQWAGAW